MTAATVPCPTATARVAGQPVGDPDDGPADGRRRADLPQAPDRALGRGQPEPVDQLRLLVRPQEQVDRRIAAAQARRARPRGRSSRSARRAAPGCAALSRARWPWRPMTFCSAPSRMAQVLMTTRSASSIDGASSQPAASSRPAISSESLRFIWQPSVQTWKRGRLTTSGTYSASRSSAGVTGSRGAAAGGAPTSRTSSIGSARGRVERSVTAAPWYARSAGGTVSSKRWSSCLTPEALGRPADADRPRDRPRHRQRHLHLDPRPALAGRTSATAPGTSAWAWRWACASCCS